MTRFEIKELNVTNHDWDELVANSPQGLIFHSSDWLNLISRHTGKQLQIIQCYDVVNDPPKIVGGCVYHTYNKLFFKIATGRFEETPYGGLILASPPSKNQRKIESWQSEVTQSVLDTFKAKKFDRITLDHSPLLYDVRPFTFNGWSSEIWYLYLLDLTKDFTKNLSKEVKWSINKAIKSNITVRRVDSLKTSDIETYTNLHEMTYQRQNQSSMHQLFTYDFVKDALNMLYEKKNGTLWYAESSAGVVVAAEIVVYDKHMAHRWSAASHTDFQQIGAVSYLLGEIAKSLVSEPGCKIFNLMAATSPEISSFISSFNPQLVPFYSTIKTRKLYDSITTLLSK